MECVPNVSEGRDPVSVSRMEDAVREAGSSFLETHSDVDHHRSAFTHATDGLLERVPSLAGEALNRIDLQGLAGAHPRLRIGALDAVSLTPLEGRMEVR